MRSHVACRAAEARKEVDPNFFARTLSGWDELRMCWHRRLRFFADSTHAAQYRGRLNRIEPTETSGLEYFWHCCGNTDPNAPGCMLSAHASYDEAQ